MPEPNGAAIRAATSADAEAICRIYNAALAERGSTFETEPRSAEDFEGRIDDARYPLLVAEATQEIIGWAGLASYSRRPCYAGIGECSVYVAVEARGRGVGTALTAALAGAAHGNGNSTERGGTCWSLSGCWTRIEGSEGPKGQRR